MVFWGWLYGHGQPPWEEEVSGGRQPHANPRGGKGLARSLLEARFAETP
jgi:hypothetical protein